MSNSSSLSLPHENCMKCRDHSDILLSSSTPFRGHCDHKFCENCFRKEHESTNIIISRKFKFKCPCCYAPVYDYIQSIDEAILVGGAVTLRTHISPLLLQPEHIQITEENLLSLLAMNEFVIEKLEAALSLNPTNFYTLYVLLLSYSDGHRWLDNHNLSDGTVKHYRLKLLKLFDYSYRILDHPTVSEEGKDALKFSCYYELARLFRTYKNYSAALKYAKQAYEYCLRSTNTSNLPTCKDLCIESRVNFAKLSPLRFAVGDEVEFLHELETGSEWRVGKIVERHYYERNFDIHFSAPYRLQILDDKPPAYAWVKADIDRYVRKVGVRSIEDTRYQARLDAKVEELARVYCSKEFIHDIYSALVQDCEFVDMLQSVWQIELSERLLHLYRMLVMYRQPFIRTNSGYHIPTADEVIAGIRALFDPTHLGGDAAPSAKSEISDSQLIRAEILKVFHGDFTYSANDSEYVDFQWLLLRSIRYYIDLLSLPDSSMLTVDLPDQGDDFIVPPEVSEAMSRVSSSRELQLIVLDVSDRPRLVNYLLAWIALQRCLEETNAGPACECPFVYFFVKYCLEQGLGVPKLALSVYDRINMQLSREFIRCANPTCELNKLDKSTGQVKFKQCSRCHAVIYCSRECQTAHYPEHKRLCREPTG